MAVEPVDLPAALKLAEEAERLSEVATGGPRGHAEFLEASRTLVPALASLVRQLVERCGELEKQAPQWRPNPNCQYYGPIPSPTTPEQDGAT